MRLHPTRRPARPSTVVAAGLAGVLLLISSAVMLTHDRTLPHAYGPSAVPAIPSAGATASALRPAPASPPVTTPPPAPTVVTDPVSLRLDAFDVTAPITNVSTRAGRLDPPDDPAQVGWWIASAPAGSTTGTTVVVGHVDGPAGPGAFYRLVHARPGDALTVADSNGIAVHYRVQSLQYVAKADGLPSALFTQDGPARLVLVSCGGTFDRSSDQYADNVVVTALPG